MSKRRAGRNKTRAKQRAYKASCYAKRTAGLVTDAFGNWVQPRMISNPVLTEAQIRATTAK